MSTPSTSTATSQAQGHSHSHKHAHRHRALSLGAARSRDEARLGITTDYKDLSLHSAAANGNLGLVQYALSHGQPVNSVLNGVLPLHAAASSGNETVVRMLIEAGADVNSPRLSRRYTREGSKSTGVSVGSQGSTPLHFAAANGHAAVLTLLLSYGADPRTPEKHGLTPAQMALTNGHRDAAALLHARAVQLDDADERSSQASSRSGGGAGGGNGRPPSVRSSLSMTRRRPSSGAGIGTGVNAQRSFDALASRLAQATAHTTPLHALGLASSSSLHSLASLASSATGGHGHAYALGSGSPASSSQISLGAVSSSGSGAGLGGPLSRQGSRKEGGGGSTTRRPSLPSVWEKAAHPRAALRQAFSRSGGGGASGGSGRSEAGTLSEEDEDPGAESAEYAEHRRSLDLHRPLRRDSYQGVEAISEQAADTVGDGRRDSDDEDDDEDDVPTPVQTRAPQLPLVAPQQPPPPVGTLSRASSHRFYRPRQSSQLSKSSFGDGYSSFDVNDADESVFDDDREITPPPLVPSSPPAPPTISPPASPRRARAASNPGPQSAVRSPLLQQVQLSQQQQQHFHQLQLKLRRAREEASADTSTASSSRRPSTTGSTGADGEWSSSSAAEETDTDRPELTGLRPPVDARRAFLDPSLIAPPPSALSLSTTAAQNRARSNSASTDGSLAARSSTYSFAPSTSTAPTSVGAPSSPGGGGAGERRSGKEAAVTAVPMGGGAGSGAQQGRYLSPVFEVRSQPPSSAAGAGGAASDDEEPQTQAQARSRVQRAERELLAMAALEQAGTGAGAPSSSRAGSAGSSGSRATTSHRSLKDQLAAYGKSLKAERELVEREERERRATAGTGRKVAEVQPGFTLETISKSTPASVSSADSPSRTPTLAAVPSWRAIPSLDRLVPPPTAVSGRRSVSPSATSSAASAHHHHSHHRRASQELDTVIVPAVLASKTTPPRAHSHAHGATATDGTAPPARAGSPTSLRSSSAKSSSTTTVAAAPAAVPAVAPVLGQGHGGVSFVGVAPKAPASATGSPLAAPHTQSHGHHHHHHHASGHAQPRSSRSDKSHSERGGAASSGPIKTRDQVEEDRREKARLEERVPRAVRTVPQSERRGFKRWFASGSGSGSGSGGGAAAGGGGPGAKSGMASGEAQ